jgi:hypothetical protein
MTDPIVTTTYKSVKVKYTHYGVWNYYVSFAVSFGYRAVPTTDANCKIVRLWLDGTLIYDCYTNVGADNFIFFPGTEDQPFYRGQMVLFLGSINLDPSSLAVPSVTAEIVDGADLISVVGDTFVARHLTPAWAEYSPDLVKLMQAFDDTAGHAFRSVSVKTNTETGTVHSAATFDMAQPVIFAPWQSFALAQNDAQKVLLNTADGLVISTFGGTSEPAAPDYQNFPSSLFGIGQNAGRSFSAGTTFFVLASDVDGFGHYPYQIAYVNNNKLVYGAGRGDHWTDKPVCMARGQRLGNDIAAEQSLLFGTPPVHSTGDVLVAFDYAVRRLRVGVAGSGPLSRDDVAGITPPALTPNLTPTLADDQIYSHDPSVGKIVRLYNYNLYGDLREAENPIILLIETDAANHRGVARKIAYDGTIIWTTGTIDLDGVTDAALRTMQTTADLTANRLGIISYHTSDGYTVINLSSGAVETGTYSGVTIAGDEPAFWLSTKDTFYPLRTDNKHIRVGVPGDAGVPLDDAIRSLALRAGYADEDIIITGLHDTLIQGYIVGASTTLGDILNNMSTLYQFSYAEIAGQLYVISIFDGESFTSVVTVPETDLAKLTESQAGDEQIINVVIADDAGMPLAINGRYIDPAVAYQQNVQTAQRSAGAVTASKTSTITVPVIMTGADMLARLYRALYNVWASQDAMSIRLPAKYLTLIPTDGFTFTALDFEHRVTIVQATVNADFSISLTLAERSFTNRLPVVETQVPLQPFASGPVAPIRALMLDLPDTSPAAEAIDTLNLGVALSGYVPGQWVSGRLDLAVAHDPASWATRLNTVDQTPIGTVLAITGPALVNPFATDLVTTMTIELGTIALADLIAASYDDMLAGATLTAVGRDGRYELIQWGAIVDNGDGTVTISTLFRGRFGTDAVVGMIEVGDFFIPYNGIKFVTYPVADYFAHTAYAYRGVVPNENPEDATQGFIIPNGNSHRQYAPVQLHGYRITDTDNSVDLRFRRRVRFGGELTDPTSDIPIDAGRTFSLDLYSADMTSIALRVESFTVADADPFDHYTFTQSQMEAAGYADDATTFNVIVYQVDDVIGRGWGSFGGPVPISDIAFDGAIVIAGAMGKVGASIVLDNPFSALTVAGALGRVSGSAAVVVKDALTMTSALGHVGSAVVMTITVEPAVTMAGALGHIGGSIVATITTGGGGDELTYNGDSLTYDGDTLEYD